MAQVIVTLCDPCSTQDVERPGHEVQVTINGDARAIDVCDEHDEQMVAPLRSFARFHGRKLDPATAVSTSVEKRPSSAPRGVCQLCNDGTEINLPGHARSKHRLTYQQYLVRTGQAEPSDMQCTVCDPAVDLGQLRGLLAHGRSVHGMGREVFLKELGRDNDGKLEAAPANGKRGAKKTAPGK